MKLQIKTCHTPLKQQKILKISGKNDWLPYKSQALGHKLYVTQKIIIFLAEIKKNIIFCKKIKVATFQ